MKDKLKELSELVRDAYRAGFIAACKWPAPVTQDVDSSAYNKEFNDWSFSVREKHAAILDAEGDGVAVAAWQFQSRDGTWYEFMDEKHRLATEADGTWPIRALITHPARSGGSHQCEMCKKLQGQIAALHTVLDVRESRRAHTHPARSGVVSDEDVEIAAKAIFLHWQFKSPVPWIAGGNSLMQGVARDYARAAFESYERNRK